ncbi:DUF7373 family lipoprotein [Tsukamurella paurometabola]|uniref:Lipoprotein n=1 Tax=Tsukamurella paurometabola TaxID=2061 RepID=A0A3P8MB56_TSUPA|nr:hypothetical protein [Tsukamurella paurometabola]UEA84950.1 hypothetical protein LK411_09100 [Tsukamurella paurometabola]VDR37546.1 Uncharacterised protein [Tsukamurella paurometabola]
MNTRLGAAPPAIALVAALVSACSTVVAGTPVAETTVARLDPGNFPTTPRTVTAESAADAWQQEGMILADAVIAPSDVDAALTALVTDEFEGAGGPLLRIGQIIERNSLRGVPVGGIPPAKAASLELNTKFDVGFMSTAGDSATTPRTQLSATLLRFSTDAGAEKAVITLRADPPAPAALARIPGAVLVSSASGGGVTKTVVAAPVNNLVALVWATTRGTDSADLAIRGLTSQLERARTYRPSIALSSVVIPAVPMDRDGIMSRTLESQNDNQNKTRTAFGLSSGFELGDGYFTARTAYLINRNPGWLRVATRNGIDLIGKTNRTSVLRARDRASAKVYLVEVRVDPGSTQAYEVPGLSRDDAGCTYDSVLTRPYTCYATVGRYVLQAESTTLDLARQAISATYLINRTVGEN